jgi:hypothetical protein
MTAPENFDSSGGFPIQALFARVAIYEQDKKKEAGRIVAGLAANHGRGWYGQLLERYLSPRNLCYYAFHKTIWFQKKKTFWS